jgi:hypothetical protein
VKKVLVVGPGGNDARKLMERINILKPGSVTMVNVKHEQWCQKLTTGGEKPCDCDCIIEMGGQA